MSRNAPTYKNHRYPIEIVARVIWLYFRFNVSRREVEEMLLERGVVVSYETIRRWCRKHGPDYARRLRRKVPAKADTWHVDELVVRINGQKCWLCEPLIRTVMCSMRLSRRAVTLKQPDVC